MRNLEDRTLLVLALVVSLAFAWVVEPFFGAILWALVATVLFAPLNRRFLNIWPEKRNRAASLTLLVIVAMVVLPTIIIGIMLLQEATSIYAKIQSGEIDFGHYFHQFLAILPDWAMSFLRRMGLTNIGAVREKLSAGIASSFQTLAAQAFVIGQSAFSFLVALGVMLYLTYFLLRDGEDLAQRVHDAVPLHAAPRRALTDRFLAVIRATIKGSVVVAIIQGTIGGLVFWFLGIQGPLLWGVLMAFLSLLPAIGTGLVWVPVAIYLLVSGAIWQGVTLVFCGLFVIGMVDNVLRPILVGRDTRMPDWLVLISTLGGIEVFGFSGFIVGPMIAALFMAVWSILTASRVTAQKSAPS